jgi:hypothetical protein
MQFVGYVSEATAEEMGSVVQLIPKTGMERRTEIGLWGFLLLLAYTSQYDGPL